MFEILAGQLAWLPIRQYFPTTNRTIYFSFGLGAFLKNESMFQSKAKPNTFSDGGYFLKIKTYLTLRVKLEFPVEASSWKLAERTACDESTEKTKMITSWKCILSTQSASTLLFPKASGCDPLNLRTLWFKSSDVNSGLHSEGSKEGT